jgi:hypothetical protein
MSRKTPNPHHAPQPGATPETYHSGALRGLRCPDCDKPLVWEPGAFGEDPPCDEGVTVTPNTAHALCCGNVYDARASHWKVWACSIGC